MPSRWRVVKPRDFYFLVFALIGALVWGLYRLQGSRIGRAWNYVREDEVAAEAMGIDVSRVKLLAISLGAGIAGATGTIHATKLLIISPESFSEYRMLIFGAAMVVMMIFRPQGLVPSRRRPA